VALVGILGSAPGRRRTGDANQGPGTILCYVSRVPNPESRTPLDGRMWHVCLSGWHIRCPFLVRLVSVSGLKPRRLKPN